VILLKILIYPLALLYALIVHLRNKLFDWNIIKSKSFGLPVIAVGNLSYGGTGKTPHIEYLIHILQDKYKLAVISRGYGRKTKGFIIAADQHTVLDIGDEPMQYLTKYPEITVAVDEKRAHGIEKTLELRPETELVLLDDAFQHRYVKPGLSILLTDFHHLYVDDYPLPTGTLREFRAGASRADLIVITKTPRIFSPILRRELSKKISPRPHQRVFYSYIDYSDAVPLKVTGIQIQPATKYRYILMFSGIANSYPLQDYLRNLCGELIVRDFPDHHKYSARDLEGIINTYHNILSKDKVIFTTEKDAMRLECEQFSGLLSGLPVYYIPIRIRFHHCDDVRFDKFILSYAERSK
jgi:tetraacyldisaccharide 4'-kinase